MFDTRDYEITDIGSSLKQEIEAGSQSGEFVRKTYLVLHIYYVTENRSEGGCVDWISSEISSATFEEETEGNINYKSLTTSDFVAPTDEAIREIVEEDIASNNYKKFEKTHNENSLLDSKNYFNKEKLDEINS